MLGLKIPTKNKIFPHTQPLQTCVQQVQSFVRSFSPSYMKCVWVCLISLIQIPLRRGENWSFLILSHNMCNFTSSVEIYIDVGSVQILTAMLYVKSLTTTNIIICQIPWHKNWSFTLCHNWSSWFLQILFKQISMVLLKQLLYDLNSGTLP